MTLWRRLMTLGLLMTTAFSLAATETDATLTFYVDAPAMNVWQEQDIEVGGWIWGGIEDPVERVVLESEDWSFPLDFLLERNDVADHLGDKQAANSGFHGRRALPATMSSDSTFFIAAYRVSGARIELKRLRYRPVTLSTKWQPWLARYPEFLGSLLVQSQRYPSCLRFAPGLRGLSNIPVFRHHDRQDLELACC